MASRDDDADDEPHEDEAEPNETPPAPAQSPPASIERKARKRSGSKARRAEARREANADARTETRGRNSGGWDSAKTRLLGVAVVAVAAGAAAGWFGHDAQARAKLRKESAAAAAGSSGPCDAWQQKICESSGEKSAACAQAKNAIELLTPTTCEVALGAVPATLDKMKAARAPCDELTTKLCNELPKGSEACKMVQERTPEMPAANCKEMLGHYDEVLGQLKMLDQQGGPPMGGSPHGPPPGGRRGPPPGALPPGALPPGAMPPGAMPPGAKPPGAPPH